MNEQCIGYLRVLCDKVFQCPITAEQAKMLFDAIDENKDGYLQLDEILRKKKSKKDGEEDQENKQQSGDNSDEDKSDKQEES